MNVTKSIGTFPATLEGLDGASMRLAAELKGLECPKNVVAQLMVATDEIASNIVHYSGAPDFELVLETGGDAPFVRLSFSDGGKPWNPLEKSDPDVTLAAQDRDVGGLGIFMVKRLMDEVAYSHENGRNVLTVGKRLPEGD